MGPFSTHAKARPVGECRDPKTADSARGPSTQFLLPAACIMCCCFSSCGPARDFHMVPGRFRFSAPGGGSRGPTSLLQYPPPNLWGHKFFRWLRQGGAALAIIFVVGIGIASEAVAVGRGVRIPPGYEANTSRLIHEIQIRKEAINPKISISVLDLLPFPCGEPNPEGSRIKPPNSRVISSNIGTGLHDILISGHFWNKLSNYPVNRNFLQPHVGWAKFCIAINARQKSGGIGGRTGSRLEVRLFWSG